LISDVTEMPKKNLRLHLRGNEDRLYSSFHTCLISSQVWSSIWHYNEYLNFVSWM
jgi:hypothetical protein